MMSLYDILVLLVFVFLASTSFGAGQRHDHVGVAYSSFTQFSLSYRNTAADSTAGFGMEFILGGTTFTPKAFVTANDEWSHLTTGAYIIYHIPRWHIDRFNFYGKVGIVGMWGQGEIPDTGGMNANLGIVQFGAGADYALTSRLVLSAEILPSWYWATFTGDFDFLNEAALSDRSEFAPAILGFRFSMAFQDLFQMP